MKLCPKCGYSNSDADSKCRNCYTNISEVKSYEPNTNVKSIKKVVLSKKRLRIKINIFLVFGVLLMIFAPINYIMGYSEEFPNLFNLVKHIYYFVFGLALVQIYYYLFND